MGEPEGLLIEGARVAVAGARDLWWRVRPAAATPDLVLAQVRQRLELLLNALYGRRVPILPADPEPTPTWLARLFGRAPRHLAAVGALAATDGRHVWLPRALDARDGEPAALDRYRLLAVEQAARIARGFARAHPHEASPTEHDLYWVAAAAVVDHGLARELPGLAPGLRAARVAARAARPSLERLTEAERAVEWMVRDVLAADLASPALAGIDTPDEARAWARAQALSLRTAGRYRGVAPVALWGEPRPPATSPGAREGGTPDPSPPRPGRTAVLRRRPRARPARDDEDDASRGMWMVRFDDPMESAEDPMGLQRPADHDDSADAGALGDALADLPEARIVRTAGSPREVLQSDAAPLSRVAGDTSSRAVASGITYPEWDHRLAAYRFPGATVRPTPAAEAGVEWADRVLERRATLVRQVRRRFDGLRPRRVRLGRQPDGTELDLAAYVTAFADWRAGEPGDDRLYTTSRPARRDLAIAVLADVSASTDAWVSGSLRIVDVEKEALVVLLEALDVLGDRHAVLAFSGQGPRAVHVLTVKDFDEASRTAARRRIAALEPDGYTRVGAAVRHASALLGRERARHRLLLLLSDGKPNDVDEYAGRYGIEDTRQAVAEARLQGLMPFCLTVDREAPAYLPAIFGPRGFAVLSRPERLPTVLVEVLRSLVTG
jgi:nitric oxide reductase NorD protein